MNGRYIGKDKEFPRPTICGSAHIVEKSRIREGGLIRGLSRMSPVASIGLAPEM